MGGNYWHGVNPEGAIGFDLGFLLKDIQGILQESFVFTGFLWGLEILNEREIGRLLEKVRNG